MLSELPHVVCFHVRNESLLQDLLRGKPKAAIYRRVVEQVLAVADAGVDLLVMTCSSTSPGQHRPAAVGPANPEDLAWRSAVGGYPGACRASGSR